MKFSKRAIMGLTLLSSLLSLEASNVKIIGDFESKKDITQRWRGRPGIWAKGGCGISINQLYATKGQNSLKVMIFGSEKKRWPYLDYYFKKGDKDLSYYDRLKLDIYNTSKQNQLLKGRINLDSLNDPGIKKSVLPFFLMLKPGANTKIIKIGQKKIRYKKEIPNWAKAINIKIFVDSPKKDFTIYLDNIRLIKTGHQEEKASIQKTKKKTITVENLKLTPVIDGKEDNCFKNVSEIMFADNYGKKSSLKTWSKIGYNKEGLFILVSCFDKNMENLRPSPKGSPWGGDSLEVFISSGQKSKYSYLHFCIGANGYLYDEQVLNGVKNPRWHKNWTFAIKKYEDRWLTEIKLPWHIFDINPTKSVDWKMNIFRNKPQARLYDTLNPTFSGFHNPDKFIRLNKITVAKKFGLICSKVKLGKGLLGKNTFKISLNNKTSKTIYAKAILKLDDPKNPELNKIYKVPINLVKGNNKIAIDYNLENLQSKIINFSIIDFKNTQLFELEAARLIPPKPMLAELNQPCYRNFIFSDQKIKNIKGTISTNVADSIRAKINFNLTLASEDNQKIINKLTISSKADKSKYDFSIPCESLKIGKYQLKITMNLGTDIIHEQIITVRKLPYKKGQVRIDENRNLVIDGKKIFVVGMCFPGPSWFKDLAEHGFNTQFAYHGFSRYQRKRKVFELAQSHGIGTVVTIGQSLIQKPSKNVMKPNMNKIADYIKTVREYSGLICYDIMDEPNGKFRYAPPKNALPIRTLMNKMDPYHPVTLVHVGTSYVSPNYSKISDIYTFDYYQGFFRNGDCSSPLSRSALKTREIYKSTKGKMPIWVMLAGYDRIQEGNHLAKGRLANYTETRCQMYSNIAEGAKGILYWCFHSHHFGGMSGRMQWFGITKNTEELQKMSPVLVAPDSSKKIKLNRKFNDFHYIAKNVNGTFYLIAANTSKKIRKIKFTIPGFEQVKNLHVLGENRQVQVKNSSFTDSFTKYAVHIYTNDNNAPKLRLIKENLAQEKKINQEYNKRNADNLVFRAYENELLRINTNIGRRRSCYQVADGLRNTFWPYGGKKLPVSFELTFLKPQDMSKIIIRSSIDYIKKSQRGVLEDFKIQYFKNGLWIDLAEVKNNTQLSKIFLFKKITASKIRIIITKVNGYLALDEIEIYKNK